MKKLKFFWIFAWSTLCLIFIFWDESFQLEKSLSPPSFPYLMGHDPFGRNLFFLQLKAFAQSARLALIATFLILITSLCLGTFFAFSNAKVRTFFEHMIFFFLSFPSLILALIIAAFYGPGWNTLLVALTLGMLPFGIQLVYYKTLDILKEDFISATRSLGADSIRIIYKHICPHLFPLLSVKIPYFFSRAMLAEATLSFLGVGAPLGATSMGVLFALSRDYLIEAPWIMLFVSIPFIITVYSLLSLSENEVVNK